MAEKQLQLTDEERQCLLELLEQTLKESGGMGTLRVLLHSLAFGTLKLMVGAEAKDVATRARTETS